MVSVKGKGFDQRVTIQARKTGSEEFRVTGGGQRAKEVGIVGKMKSRVDGFVKAKARWRGHIGGGGWTSHVTGGAGWGRERDLGISGRLEIS